MHDFSGFLRGRVDLMASGGQIEQFINLLHREKIHPHNLNRSAEDCLYLTLSKKEFKHLRIPAFKTGTKIKIIKKRGLFMILRPMRRRIGFLIGIAVFAAFLIWCSRFVWRVEIQGNHHLSETQLMEDLEPYGFFIGCRRNLDVGMIENRYLIGNPRLSWLSINIKGTTAYIEVKEKGFTPEVLSDSTPTNIYASRDGVILSITDFSGNRVVEVGEAVHAGDLLISGERTDEYNAIWRVRSVGKVMARTFRKACFSVPNREIIREKTGRKRKFSRIFLGKLQIPLYFKKKISYNDYDYISEKRILHLGSFALPISWERSTYWEVEQRAMDYSNEQRKAKAGLMMKTYEKDRLAGIKIIDRTEHFFERNDCLELEVVFICEESIGYERKIED